MILRVRSWWVNSELEEVWLCLAVLSSVLMQEGAHWGNLNPINELIIASFVK